MNDLAKTIEPKSDQQNADDFLSGPRTIKARCTALDCGGLVAGDGLSNDFHKQ